jgi:hypothetical protein
MGSRNISLNIKVIDSHGAQTSKTITVVEQKPRPVVAGGYYVTSNGNMQNDTINQGMNLRSFTQYHSLAEPALIPGPSHDYLKDYGKRGIWGNYVVEFKHYGISNTGAQSLTVEGIKYNIPAPNMLIQKKSPNVLNKAYGYEQIWSGQCDGLLHRLLVQIRNMGNIKFNVQIASELDTDHEYAMTENAREYTWAQADERAVRAVAYVVDYLRSKGVQPGVTFTVGSGGWDRVSWKRTHPESLMAKLDYIQWNVYRRSPSQTAYDLFNRTKLWTEADLGPVAKSKDIIIAEWGTPANFLDQGIYIKTVPAAIKKLNNESVSGYFVMTNYFNSNDAYGTLSPKQGGLDALKTAYSQNPYA